MGQGQSQQQLLDHVIVDRYLHVVNRVLARRPRARRRAANRVLAIRIEGPEGETRFVVRCTGGQLELVDTEPDRATAATVRRQHLVDIVTQPWLAETDPSRIELPVLG